MSKVTYSVLTLEEDQKLDPADNYGVVNDDTLCIEARTSSLPQAMATAYHMEKLMALESWKEAIDKLLDNSSHQLPMEFMN